jgi:hypothetical protein
MAKTVIAILSALLAQEAATIERAGRTAEVFWDQFSAVQSLERVTQSRLQADGKVLASRTTEFDYVAVLKMRASGVAVEESRVARGTGQLDTADQFLLTSGFPALLLMFHPDFRNRFEFWESPAPDAPSGTVRIGFKSRTGERSMSALKLQSRFYPILWHGFAWIEPGSGNIVRIEAGLDAPMDDVGLSELQAQVEYRPVAIEGGLQYYRLPSRATVSVRTPKQQWRNVHEFSAYKLFKVTTTTSQAGER